MSGLPPRIVKLEPRVGLEPTTHLYKRRVLPVKLKRLVGAPKSLALSAAASPSDRSLSQYLRLDSNQRLHPYEE